MILSVRSLLPSPGLYRIWMRGSNGRSVETKVSPKSCERNSRKPPTSDTSPLRITWSQIKKRARVKSIGHVADGRENTFKSNQNTEHYSGGDSLLFLILCQWIIRSNKHFGDATCESEDYNWHLFTVFFRCKQQKNWGNCAVLLKTQVDEKWSTTAKTFEDISSYCTACTDSFKESLTFPEWSGLIAMPNSVWMKVWLIRWVTSLNVFP